MPEQQEAETTGRGCICPCHNWQSTGDGRFRKVSHCDVCEGIYAAQQPERDRGYDTADEWAMAENER